MWIKEPNDERTSWWINQGGGQQAFFKLILLSPCSVLIGKCVHSVISDAARFDLMSEFWGSDFVPAKHRLEWLMIKLHLISKWQLLQQSCEGLVLSGFSLVLKSSDVINKTNLKERRRNTKCYCTQAPFDSVRDRLLVLIQDDVVGSRFVVCFQCHEPLQRLGQEGFLRRHLFWTENSASEHHNVSSYTDSAIEHHHVSLYINSTSKHYQESCCIMSNSAWEPVSYTHLRAHET